MRVHRTSLFLSRKLQMDVFSIFYTLLSILYTFYNNDLLRIDPLNVHSKPPKENNLD